MITGPGSGPDSDCALVSCRGTIEIDGDERVVEAGTSSVCTSDGTSSDTVTLVSEEDEFPSTLLCRAKGEGLNIDANAGAGEVILPRVCSGATFASNEDLNPATDLNNGAGEGGAAGRVGAEGCTLDGPVSGPLAFESSD